MCIKSVFISFNVNVYHKINIVNILKSVNIGIYCRAEYIYYCRRSV